MRPPFILADTSIWIDHLRRPDKALCGLLNAERLVMHRLVIGELHCGHIPPAALKDLRTLPLITEAMDDEVFFAINRYKLAAQGCGFLDLHLLTACFLDGTKLWTRDKNLAKLCGKLAIGWAP